MILNNYYQLISVSLMRGVVININSAAKRIIRYNGRSLHNSKFLTQGRAECLLGSFSRIENAAFFNFS